MLLYNTYVNNNLLVNNKLNNKSFVVMNNNIINKLKKQGGIKVSIIQQIYDNRVSEESRLRSDRELDKRINDIIKRGNFEENEKVSNLFFEAGGCGQRVGFQLGFKTAVVIMLECLAPSENFI